MKTPRTVIAASLACIAILTLASSTVNAQGTTTATEGTGTSAASPATATNTESKLIGSFTEFTGSEENATSLIKGLRSGTEISLSDANTGSRTGTTAPASTTFSPGTKPMGYGNIKIALSLAKAQLASQGITSPTATQLQGALAGEGQQQGILQMRASGMGWGQIANSLGVKLGAVVSGKAPATTAATTTSTTGGVSAASQGRAAGAKTVVTATGQGNAYGRSGVVTAAGGTVSGGGHAYGKGVVTATGMGNSGVASSVVGQGNAYGRGGIATAAGGNSGGGGNAYGKGGKP